MVTSFCLCEKGSMIDLYQSADPLTWVLLLNTCWLDVLSANCREAAELENFQVDSKMQRIVAKWHLRHPTEPRIHGIHESPMGETLIPKALSHYCFYDVLCLGLGYFVGFWDDSDRKGHPKDRTPYYRTPLL